MTGRVDRQVATKFKSNGNEEDRRGGGDKKVKLDDKEDKRAG